MKLLNATATVAERAGSTIIVNRGSKYCHVRRPKGLRLPSRLSCWTDTLTAGDGVDYGRHL